KIIPKNMIVDLTGDGEGGKMKDQMDCSKDEEKCITISELLSDANGGAYNLLTAYAYGIFNIDRYKDITKNQIEKGSVKKVGDILRKIGLGIIFFIVFGVLVIAIVYALLTRAMMLWMFAIFSPLFALNFVLGGGKSKALEKLGKLDIKHFISLAMVPVYVSAALSFGLMFLSLVMNPPVDGSAKRTSVDGKQTFTMGQITLTTIGDPNMMDNLGTGFQTGQGIVSTIILGFLALAILWMAVMAALSADEITGHAVEPIANFGKSVGELAVKAPQYIPLKLPGMDKGISMHGLGQAGGTIASNIQTASGKTGQDFADKIFGKNELTNASREAITTLNSVGKEGVKNARAFEALQKVLKTGGNPKELSQNGTAREMIAAAAASLDIKDLGDISNEASMAKAIGRIDKTLKPFGKDLMPSLDTNTATPEQIKTGIANMHIQNVSNYNVEKVNIPDGQDVGTIIVNDTANKKKINVPITIKDSNLNTDSFTKALIDNGIKDSTEQQNIINNVNEWLEKKKTTPTAPEKPKS
ncbi:MAG: hypothetical protein Q8K26_03750, partial [Candidatus Gracilibacteria bacterium]|nr:hypothetical protein [Candidatus Gracilibacteria bacterium]